MNKRKNKPQKQSLQHESNGNKAWTIAFVCGIYLAAVASGANKLNFKLMPEL